MKRLLPAATAAATAFLVHAQTAVAAAASSTEKQPINLPLGPNRSLHMIRAGREIVLVGVAEHGVAPIRSYTEEEAYEAGLISDDPDDAGGTGGTGAGAGTVAKTPFASPAQALSGALDKLRQRTVRQ